MITNTSNNTEQSNPIALKIQSFFDHGFLSGKDLEEHLKTIKEQGGSTETSFDTKRGPVPLNCISKTDSIAFSLFKVAKGGFCVMVEERIGKGGLLDTAIAKNADALSQASEVIFSQSSFLPKDMVLQGARQLVISKDPEFVKSIESKCNRTALFILKDMVIQSNEADAMDGCQETSRVKISPHKIQQVLISKEFTDEVSNLPQITLVDCYDTEFTFHYKSEDGNSYGKIKLDGKINIPNYEKALKDLVDNRDLKKDSLKTDPLYTHMTRI